MVPGVALLYLHLHGFDVAMLPGAAVPLRGTSQGLTKDGIEWMEWVNFWGPLKNVGKVHDPEKNLILDM